MVDCYCYTVPLIAFFQAGDKSNNDSISDSKATLTAQRGLRHEQGRETMNDRTSGRDGQIKEQN